MLTFDVHGQTLIRTDDFTPATDSVNYLMAKFAFKSDEWRTGSTKTAQFRLGETVYPAILDTEGKCIVPWEALVHGDSQYARKNGSTIFVSLKGERSTTKVTTDEVPVKLNSSGYGDTETPEEPTAGEYQQIMTAFGEMQEAVTNALISGANAVKGVKTGALVGMGDVSPFPHKPTVKVHSRNILNPIKFLSGNSTTSRTYVDDVLTVTGYYVSQVIEGLTVGKTYTLSFTSTRTGTTGGGVAVEFRDADNNNLLGYYHTSTLSKTMTFTVPEGTHHLGIYLYGSSSTSGTTSATYTKIMLVEGDTATDYTPYIDPATVQVIQLGKNLLEITDKSETVNGVTFTVNDDGSIRAVGTSTAVITKFISTDSASVANGERYILSGCPAGGSHTTFSLRCYGYDDSDMTLHDCGDGVEIPWANTGGQYNFAISIASGVTMNHVFYPMLRHASIEDDSFELYGVVATGIPGVDEFQSISPCMTFMPEVEGAVVEVEYNRNTTQAISMLGAGTCIVNMVMGNDGATIATVDKTYAEILAAFKAGKQLECRVYVNEYDGYYILPPTRVHESDGIIFAGHSGNTGSIWTSVSYSSYGIVTFTQS